MMAPRQLAAFTIPPLADMTDAEIDDLAAVLADTVADQAAGWGSKVTPRKVAEHYPGGHSHNQKAHAGAGHGAAAVAAHEDAPGKDSFDAHQRPGGGFTEERSAFHDAVIAERLSGLPRSGEPTLYMTGGGPASGKTKALLDNPEVGIPAKDRAAHIDPDSMKAAIPEYNLAVAFGRSWAAAHAHEESSYMAKLGVHRALRSGHDVVYDSVGDSGIDKLTAKVAGFRQHGAKRVHAEYVTVDTETAIARSAARAKKTGRMVPESVIRQGHADVSRTFKAAVDRGLFDSARLWDNSGSRPVLVFSFEKGSGGRVHDQTLWEQFVAKGRG